MENFLTAVIWVALGCACAYYAKRQQRNPYLWFFIGLTLGIFGLLLLLMIPLIQKLRKGSKEKQEGATNEIAPTPTTFSLASSLDDSSTNTLWYYLDETSAQKGPMSFTLFEKDWKEGKFLSSSYVWNEKLTDWKLFSELFPSAEKELVK